MKDFFGNELAVGDVIVQVAIGYTMLEYTLIKSIGKASLVTYACNKEGILIDRHWQRKCLRAPESVIKVTNENRNNPQGSEVL
jgi:hypothetical protein